jgi:diguanylate cyclase (GGDEF)-like protein
VARLSPREAAEHFDALWRSGLTEGALDAECDTTAALAAAAAGASAAAVVVYDGSRRWCAGRSGALPRYWDADEAPAGWRRTGGVEIATADGRVIAELATFDVVGADGPGTAPADPHPEILRGLARLLEVLIDRHSTERARTAGAAVVDDHGVLCGATASLEDLVGWSPDDRLGENMLELLHPDDLGLAAEGFGTSIQTAGRKTPMDIRIAGAEGRWVQVAVTADNRLDDPSIGAIVFEVIDRDRHSALDVVLGAQTRVLELVARGAAIAEIARAIVRMVEENIAGARAWVAAVDEERGVLRPLGSVPAAGLAEVAVKPTAVPAGAAAWRRQAVIAGDVPSDPLWDDARPVAEVGGILADWAMPAMTTSRRAVGVVDVLLPRPAWPSPEEDRILVLAAQLLVVALERHDAEGRLAHQATHDPLTGLPNRAYLKRRFGDDVPTAERPRSLLICEARGLDPVYGTFGHGAGDELLTAVADRICALLRQGDIACRLGDNQFAVLLHDHADAALAVGVARRLLRAMAEPFAVYGRDVFVDLHIGIAASASTNDRLLLEADVALMRARTRRGPGFELFDPSMLSGMIERVELEAELRRGLAHDQLVVHYQPKVDLATGEIVGAEALVRWEHPRRGLVAPGEFVPLLEESGLIVAAGRRVLDRACSDAAAWPARASGAGPISVAVNVSIRQLEDPGLYVAVLGACRAADLDPASLVLEITETALSDRHEEAQAVLGDLRAAGVHLSIDDFGTGYSSFVRLRDFRVDEVKIDRAFVAEITDDQQDVPVIAAMIAMAQSLGLRTVAEGVETEVQANVLRALGCDQAQGFHYARPAPTLPADLSERA